MQIKTAAIEYSPIRTEAFIESANKLSDFSKIRARLGEIIENILSPDKDLSLEEKLNEEFLEMDFGSEFDIDATKISPSDAIFFINLLNQENIINYKVEDNKLSISLDDKKINATNSLLNMLQTSFDTKKSIRLDFDRDVTVILKLDKEGKIQAHFIPGSSEVESYLKTNIPVLKQNFDKEEINYSYLGYSENKNKNKKGSKKEQ